MQSYVQYLAEPLESAGYKVLVFADLMGDVAREKEVTRVLQDVFGSALCEARVKEWLSGLNQVGSLISWDVAREKEVL
jgi:hypothetical protein